MGVSIACTTISLGIFPERSGNLRWIVPRFWLGPRFWLPNSWGLIDKVDLLLRPPFGKREGLLYRFFSFWILRGWSFHLWIDFDNLKTETGRCDQIVKHLCRIFKVFFSDFRGIPSLSKAKKRSQKMAKMFDLYDISFLGETVVRWSMANRCFVMVSMVNRWLVDN